MDYKENINDYISLVTKTLQLLDVDAITEAKFALFIPEKIQDAD